MVGWAMMSHAQRYETVNGKIYFGKELVMYADVRSFVDLGCGYAKDHHNVYMNGRVLENVDPSTFRLKEPGSWRQHGRHDEGHAPHGSYFKSNGNVFYDGEKVVGANGHSFEDLGDGYAKDSFNGYYRGEKVNGSSGSSFQYLGNGYAKDSFNGYYCGVKVNGASGSSFQYLGDGYAKDSFNGYYCGVKVNGSSGSSFQYLSDGYAKDNFNIYYRGKKK